MQICLWKCSTVRLVKFHYVTLLDGLTVTEINGKHVSWYEHFFGETLRFVYSLHSVGELGTVKIKIKTDTTPSWRIAEYTVHLWDTP